MYNIRYTTLTNANRYAEIGDKSRYVTPTRLDERSCRGILFSVLIFKQPAISSYGRMVARAGGLVRYLRVDTSEASSIARVARRKLATGGHNDGSHLPFQTPASHRCQLYNARVFERETRIGVYERGVRKRCVTSSLGSGEEEVVCADTGYAVAGSLVDSAGKIDRRYRSKGTRGSAGRWLADFLPV